MDKKDILNKLKQDYETAKDARATIDTKIVEWRKAYNAEPLGNEVANKSKFVARDIKKLLKWQLPTILEPFVNTPEIVRCRGTNAETMKTAKAKEKLLNYWFCRNFDRYNFMRNAIKLLQKEGTVVIRTGWNIKTEKVKETIQIQDENGNIIEQETEQEIPIINEPTAKLCKLENIYIDPSATEDKPEFIIHKYDTTLSNLKSNVPYFNESAINKIIQLKIEAEDHDNALSYQRDAELEDKGQDSDFVSSDTSRHKVTVYEYWGKFDINEDGIAENIVCAWVDDIIIKLEDNPYPDNDIPFIIAHYDTEAFSVYGENSAIDDLLDIHKLNTVIMRGLIENIANANIGQKGILKGMLDPINKRKFNAGENFEFNEPLTGSSLYEANYNQLTSTPFNMLQILDEESQMLTGITKNSLGQPTNGLSATQSNNIETATQRRNLDLVRNIAENIVKPLLRKWLSYSAEYLSEQETFYITDDENFTIDKQDLDGRVHMDMLISTQAIDDEKSRQLAFLLQTSQQSQDPEITKMLYIKLLKLNKMFEEAKALEEYQPQPDQTQMQMTQLQLQELQAKIQDLQVKMQENQADIRLKLAKAKDIESKADLNNLNFVKEATGAKHYQELDKIALSKHL